MAKAVKYRSLGTFEFLVDGDDFFFIEANPRLQVEHTVTEEVWGVDLVKTQLRLAGGAPLAKTGIADARPRGHAIQLRINMETMTDGRLGQARRRHAHACSSRPRARASASTPTAMPATAPIPTSIRCSPS